MAFTHEDTRSSKLSKEHVTVLVGGNMAGNKLPLLVIGKSSRPRSFPCTSKFPLPLVYRSNKKAWMMGNIFEEWVGVQE